MNEPFVVRRIAVLGAGVMGAQIAAHCVNAGIETYLFDLAQKGRNPNGLIDQAIKNLTKQAPSPLATPAYAALLHARNYDEHLAELRDCDLIIEAIAEKMDWKKALYRQITPYLTAKTILVTNTSGLSIQALAEILPSDMRTRFCGVHFFNPPRYMHLAELIPAEHTAPKLLDNLETWLTSRLGKGVVRAKDTPNFIANRIGVFSLLVVIHHAERLGLGLDAVDVLTGALLGRPKSATFRTMDVVGLDTMQHVVHTMQTALAADPWHTLFELPQWMNELIQQGHLGQKSGQGIYRKKGKVIEVFDPELGGYRLSNGEVSLAVTEIMRERDPAMRMKKLFNAEDSQAQFLAACFRDLFHYCAFYLETIAATVRDVDEALCWGFGWREGPFKTWQAAGVDAVRDAITQAIQAGVSLSQAPLPAWLLTCTAFYNQDGALSPVLGQDPTYQNYQNHAQKHVKFSRADILFENDGVCLSHLEDDVAVVCFKSKANTIGQSVLDGLQEALTVAEARCQGLIIYQHDATNFSSGADLSAVIGLIENNQMGALDSMLLDFQALLLRLKYSALPVVAALRGRALGGGCELMMHCDAVVAAFEAYPGLVEAGVGLIPAGGGCKEFAMRAASVSDGADIRRLIGVYFEQIARATVASSAPDALSRGFLKAADRWVMHADEVLYAALATIKSMQALNYTPPINARFQVAGREGHALLQAGLVNWLEGGFISAHDFYLSNQLAQVLCGGDVNQGEWVDEAWMLRLEREAFIQLAETLPTQARIKYLLETGKPLRN